MYTVLFALLCSNLTNKTSDLCKLTHKEGFYRTMYSCTSYEPMYNSVPDSIDWREYNIVTPVKNQGNCGSCWTFSATGAMEGAWAKKTGQLISLSEQQLVDCVSSEEGCQGGNMEDAFEYAIVNPLCTETEDPYEAKNDKCKDCESYIKFSSCIKIPKNNQLALKEVVAEYGPISIAIQADKSVFKDYKSGIISDDSCGTDLDHGVLIVGYGTENSTKYWIVKNSWGKSWGENGYVRILRSESTDDPGVCGIGMQGSFPVV